MRLCLENRSSIRILACATNVLLACFSFLVHKVTDTVIKAKHENDGRGEEGEKGREVFFPSSPLPHRFLRSAYFTSHKRRTQHKTYVFCYKSVLLFFPRDCILFALGLRNYVIYLKNLISQEPNRNFCTTLKYMRSEMNATLQT